MTRIIAFTTIAFGLFTFMGCDEDTAPQTDGFHTWGDANDFAYQLQNMDLAQLGDSHYDILVLDYSSDGTVDGEWSSDQIAALKQSPGGPKLVLAYMSIGEAEDYRFYWQPDWGPGTPSFILGENPDWSGNYLVQYWESEWHDVIYGSPDAYLDRIIAQGFDGAYLDKVDSYLDYPDRPSARQDMIDFVVEISNYARTQNPDFAIFPQNAEELGDDAAYLAACTGIGREEIFYRATNEPVPQEERNEIAQKLANWTNAGKVVLAVDYCNLPGYIDAAYALAEQYGWLEYCTTVELDRLTYNPGHMPD